MSTEQDLYNAFIDFTTKYLTTPPEEVDPKIIEWVARFLDKKGYGSVPTPPQGSPEGKAFAKIQKEHGV